MFCTLVHPRPHMHRRALHVVDCHIRTYIERAHDLRFALIATWAFIATMAFSHITAFVSSLRNGACASPASRLRSRSPHSPIAHCTRSACSPVQPSQAQHPIASMARRFSRSRFVFSFSVYAPGGVSDDTRTHPLQFSRSSGRREMEALVTCTGKRARLRTVVWTAQRGTKVCAAAQEAPT